jgi:hypothetical protein
VQTMWGGGGGDMEDCFILELFFFYIFEEEQIYTIGNKHCTGKEKKRLNSESICFYSVQNLLSLSLLLKNQQNRQCTCKVTLGRVRATVVALEKK